MLTYDIEAFPKYWCVVVVDDHNEADCKEFDRHVFEDVQSLRDYYKQNRHQTWVGYNSRQYDSAMLRFIMLGLDPYECSQALIVLKKKWWQFPMNVKEAYTRIPLKNFDCVLLNKGLKKLEGFRGSSIIECDIPWDYPHPLTREQKDKVVYYCTHDVLECRKIFYDTIEEYHAHEALIQAFELAPVHFSKTKAQLGALILGAEKKSWFDEWEFEIADTVRLDKYQYVMDWYLDDNNHDYDKTLKTEVAGVPHEFGWGGIHGARLSYAGEGDYLNMDVASYYPAMLIEYGFVSRTVRNPERYRQIRDDRIILKKNKNPMQLPYKIVLNGKSGAMKDKFNNLYDPRQNNSMCITGQLLLLDLAEKLEDYCTLIQSNTDGILVKLDKGYDEAFIKSISQEWSDRTRMILEYDRFSKVFQKDVNNYLVVPEGDLYKKSGMPNWKAKGAWLKEWYKEVEINGEKKFVQDYTEYNLVILKEALHMYFVHGTPIEDTINNCTELRKFQNIIKVSEKYTHAIHGDKILKERHLRVFASSNHDDKGVFKIHAIKGNQNKLPDTSTSVFIVNDDVTEAHTDDYPLDRQFYIDMANKRLKKFGVKKVLSK